VSRGELLLYAVLPYAAIATFLVGHWWRYRRDQYRWTARSTQILESRWLMFGSNLFHFGALAAIGGHVMGILVPHSWTDAVGLSEGAYHVVAGVGGLAAGIAATLGFVVLALRRIRFPRVRVTTTRWDVVTFFLLALGITTGMICTIWGTLGEEVRYRETVAPYFRGLLVLDPRPELMTGDEDVPFVFQLHVSSMWVLYAAWPFSRLVHAWSIPVDWFRRSPIPYRGRVAAARGGR
jgi:nitrate reductase gamma subunit